MPRVACLEVVRVEPWGPSERENGRWDDLDALYLKRFTVMFHSHPTGGSTTPEILSACVGDVHTKYWHWKCEGPGDTAVRSMGVRHLRLCDLHI